MADFLDKLTSYNLFNYLLPGVVFAVLASNLTSIDLLQEDLVTGAFFYYFLGVVISRLSSLLLEPFLKLVRFVKFENYDDYLAASKGDDQIAVLLEASNMYRTFVGVFVSLVALKIYLVAEITIEIADKQKGWAAILLLLLLFLFSYRKQTNYIAVRIRKFVDGK